MSNISKKMPMCASAMLANYAYEYAEEMKKYPEDNEIHNRMLWKSEALLEGAVLIAHYYPKCETCKAIIRIDTDVETQALNYIEEGEYD